MGDLTVQHVVLRICACLLIVSVHGGTVAGLAWLLGDPGPRDDGRLGLSPFRQLDLVGGLLLVLSTFGWMAPVALDPVRLRFGRGGLVAIVVGAECATITLAELLRLIRPLALNILPDTEATTFFIFVETLGQLCVSFTLFNMLPLPPLTGQHLLVAAWPRRRNTLRWMQPYAAALWVVLIVTGVLAQLLAPAGAAIGGIVLPA